MRHGGAQRPFWFTASVNARAVGLLDDGPRGGEILGERLLREHVLAARERSADQLDADVRMGRDVDDLDSRVVQQLVERAEDVLAEAARCLGSNVVDADDLAAVPSVRRQVRVPHDLPASDDADTGQGPVREGGPVVDHPWAPSNARPSAAATSLWALVVLSSVPEKKPCAAPAMRTTSTSTPDCRSFSA